MPRHPAIAHRSPYSALAREVVRRMAGLITAWAASGWCGGGGEGLRTVALGTDWNRYTAKFRACSRDSVPI